MRETTTHIPEGAGQVRFSELQKLYGRARANILSEEGSWEGVYPPEEEVLEAFSFVPHLSDIRVVILGQDPYINEGQAHGLSFSVNQGVCTPQSLKNIFKELSDDLGIQEFSDGCLVPWSTQGVLLLNRVLTVRAGKSKSHANLGWEDFTNAMVRYLNDFNSDIVFLLWGKDAQQLSQFIDDPSHTVLTASHPSPLSAHRGFFGCKHFSKTNEILISKGLQPIDWSI